MDVLPWWLQGKPTMPRVPFQVARSWRLPLLEAQVPREAGTAQGLRQIRPQAVGSLDFNFLGNQGVVH